MVVDEGVDYLLVRRADAATCYFKSQRKDESTPSSVFRDKPAQDSRANLCISGAPIGVMVSRQLTLYNRQQYPDKNQPKVSGQRVQ